MHLDIRTDDTYYGDKTRGNSSYWSNPYYYFNVSTSEVDRYTTNASNVANKIRS